MMFEKYDAYKDSSVEWIGKIPTDWFNERLGTILEPISIKGNADKDLLSITREKGVILRDVEDDSENHNFIPDDLSNYKLLEKGQFGMNKMKAWQGSYGVSPYTGIVSPAYYIFKFIKPIYPDFFHWAIRSKTYISFFGSASDGVRIGQWDLSKDRMKNIPFVFPNIDSQKKIVEFINDKAGKIDQAIAIKEQQITFLNERKQIVIQKAVTQGLDPNVPMKDSGVEWIGQIPEHWELEKVKRLFKLIIDPAPNNNDFELLSVYTDIGVKPRKDLEERGNRASTTDGYWKVQKGDIIVNKLLAWMGAIGLSNYDGVTSPAYDILRARKPLSPYFYHLLFRSPICSSELKKHSRGIMDMRLRLYFDKFGDVLVPYAPITEQNEIIKYIEVEEQKINAGIELINQQIEKLKEYKTTLINDAVTGKIKVA